MPNYKNSLLSHFDTIPPYTAYALARYRSMKRLRERPRLADLAKDAEMSERTFVRIARRLSWASVKFGDIEKFCRACRVDILRQTESRQYIRRSLKMKVPFPHLTREQYDRWLRQCLLWKEMRAVKASASEERQS